MGITSCQSMSIVRSMPSAAVSGTDKFYPHGRQPSPFTLPIQDNIFLLIKPIILSFALVFHSKVSERWWNPSYECRLPIARCRRKCSSVKQNMTSLIWRNELYQCTCGVEQTRQRFEYRDITHRGEMFARVCDYHSMLLFYANILVFLKLLVFMFAVTNKQNSKYNIRLRSFRLRRAYAHRNTDCYAHARASYVVFARFLLSHVMFS